MESREKYKDSVDKDKRNENQNEFFRVCNVNFPSHDTDMHWSHHNHITRDFLVLAFEDGFFFFFEAKICERQLREENNDETAMMLMMHSDTYRREGVHRVSRRWLC